MVTLLVNTWSRHHGLTNAWMQRCCRLKQPLSDIQNPHVGEKCPALHILFSLRHYYSDVLSWSDIIIAAFNDVTTNDYHSTSATVPYRRLDFNWRIVRRVKIRWRTRGKIHYSVINIFYKCVLYYFVYMAGVNVHLELKLVNMSLHTIWINFPLLVLKMHYTGKLSNKGLQIAKRCIYCQIIISVWQTVF